MASADSVDSANFAQFAKWADRMIGTDSDVTAVTLVGYTPEGLPCELYVTRRSAEEYYLSLGVGPTLRSETDAPENHYFGGFVYSGSGFSFSSSSVGLKYSGGYIEGDRSFDHVKLELSVELNDLQDAIRATGKSTLQPDEQVCRLEEALVG